MCGHELSVYKREKATNETQQSGASGALLIYGRLHRELLLHLSQHFVAH
jgi:hypothetical protein